VASGLKPDEECYTSKRLAVDGRIAFERGDLVKIVDMEPDLERPAYKYIVFSERLKMHVRLRGMDLERIYCPDCHGGPLDPDTEKCPSCGWRSPEKEVPRDWTVYHGTSVDGGWWF